MGYELVNRFPEYLYTPLGTTSNYSAIANLHTLQIATAPPKLFPAYVFNSRSLATAFTVEILQHPALTSLLSREYPATEHSQFPQLPTIISGTRLTLLITFRHEPYRKHRFHCYSPTIPRPLHAYPLPRGSVYRAVS
jgi:hypothetical protein